MNAQSIQLYGGQNYAVNANTFRQHGLLNPLVATSQGQNTGVAQLGLQSINNCGCTPSLDSALTQTIAQMLQPILQSVVEAVTSALTQVLQKVTGLFQGGTAETAGVSVNEVAGEKADNGVDGLKKVGGFLLEGAKTLLPILAGGALGKVGGLLGKAVKFLGKIF